MRTIQTCDFSFAIHETTRRGELIQPPVESGRGTFEAIVQASGTVQSLETPQGYVPHDVTTLSDFVPGQSFNLDDEGELVIVVTEQHGIWVTTRTLPG